MHYFEISNIDLIAEEYKVHSTCYKRFVMPTTTTTGKKATNTPSERTDESENNAGTSKPTAMFLENFLRCLQMPNSQ